MPWVKRILLACMALTFAGFSAVAAAPAHTHEIDDHNDSAIHVFSAHHDHHDASAATSVAELVTGNSANNTSTPKPDQHTGPSLHFHEIVHFVSADFQILIGSKIEISLDRHLAFTTTVASGKWSPLKRPPRSFL